MRDKWRGGGAQKDGSILETVLFAFQYLIWFIRLR